MRWRLGAWPAWGELLPKLNTQEECTEGSASNYEPYEPRLWLIYMSDSSEYHKLPLQMETPCCWRAGDHWRTRVFWEKRDTKLQELLYSKIIRIDYTAPVTLCYLAAFVCLSINLRASGLHTLSPDLSEQQQLLWRVQDGQKRLDERLQPSFCQILSEQQMSLVSGQRKPWILWDHKGEGLNLSYPLTDSHEYDHIFILQQSDSHFSHLIQSVPLR